MTATPEEQWRSKLGQSYPKEFMKANEQTFQRQLQSLRELPENRVCADCGARGTVWASVNLGVFLCLTCGSSHRSLGTHISKPKGCTGTYWWGPDELENMRQIGNSRAAQMYGSEPPPGVTNADGVRWKNYLEQKYTNKRPAVVAPQALCTTETGPAEPATQIDLISFTEPPMGKAQAIPTTVDFFSEFGV